MVELINVCEVGHLRLESKELGWGSEGREGVGRGGEVNESYVILFGTLPMLTFTTK